MSSFTSMDTSTAEQWAVIGAETVKNQGRVADRMLMLLRSLADVVDVFESAEPLADCAAPRSPLAPAMVEICNELARTRREQLESYTLAELAERAAVRAGPMWYI